MLSYKDRTFCQAVDCAKFNECGRALTAKVKREAARWWKDATGKKGAPISVTNRFDCYVQKENQHDR